MMNIRTIGGSTLLAASLLLTACGGGGSDTVPVQPNQQGQNQQGQNQQGQNQQGQNQQGQNQQGQNQQGQNQQGQNQQGQNQQGQNQQGQQPDPKAQEIAAASALPPNNTGATWIDEPAFDSEKRLLLGGAAGAMSYQDFVSSSGQMKYYSLNFISCGGHTCNDIGGQNQNAATGTLTFSIQYDGGKWIAKDVQLSQFARTRVDLGAYPASQNAADVTQSALTAADQPLLAASVALGDGQLEVLDEARRVWRLALPAAPYAPFQDWQRVDLHFSPDGAYVMSASSDLVMAGVRQYQQLAPASGAWLHSRHQALWQGSQLEWGQGGARLQSLALRDFAFSNYRAINSNIYRFTGQTPDASHSVQSGGYLSFGNEQSRAYAYGYAETTTQPFSTNNPVRANTGVFVIDPSGQMMVGTGGTGKSNLIGRNPETTFVLLTH